MKGRTAAKVVGGLLALATASFAFVYLAVCEFARAVSLDKVDLDG